jgi:hypothetical protein
MESETAVETAGSEAGGKNIKTERCGKDNEITILENNIKIRCGKEDGIRGQVIMSD